MLTLKFRKGPVNFYFDVYLSIWTKVENERRFLRLKELAEP
jgi:hypothetical protein